MRSLMTFAAFVAAIGFSGCCGTGGSCSLLKCGKLGCFGKKAAATAAAATNVQSYGDQTIYSDAGDCGCEGASYDQGMMQYAPADGGCGCGAPAMSSGAAACACGSDSVMSVSAPTDCGCGGAPAMSSGAAACACGSDSVVSVSAPTDCGCGGAPVMSSMPAMSGGGCGCSSCGDSSPVVSPMQFSAPAAGGCSTCDGASTAAPNAPRRFLGGRGLDKSGEGMGMMVSDRGLACNSGAERRAARQASRSLKPQSSKRTLAGKFKFGGNEEVCGDVETIDLVSNEYAECGDAGGRHISHGFISDVRGAHQARHAARGGIQGGGIHGGGIHGGGLRRAGCRGGGCGQGGKLCGACSAIRGLTGAGAGNPYGGAIPHTAQQPGQSGMAPQYAYPYYTTRGPRDFLRDNPPSIGR